jgi:hypothetical protein
MLRLLVLFTFCLAFAVPAEALDINSYRAKHGRAALKHDSYLAGIAAAHASDMARRNRLDHAGFHTQRAPMGARAENVSYGCADASCAVLQWSRSARHRAAMLLPDITSYGLASAVSADGRRYWAMELGGGMPEVRILRGKRGKKAARYLESSASRD